MNKARGRNSGILQEDVRQGRDSSNAYTLAS